MLLDGWRNGRSPKTKLKLGAATHDFRHRVDFGYKVVQQLGGRTRRKVKASPSMLDIVDDCGTIRQLAKPCRLPKTNPQNWQRRLSGPLARPKN